MSKPLTTGGGSLPFADVDTALEHVFRHYTLPFYPQLPKLNPCPPIPQMIAEMLPESVIHSFQEHGRVSRAALAAAGAMVPEHFKAMPGLRQFLAASAGYQAIKLQMAGPCVLEFVLGTGLHGNKPCTTEVDSVIRDFCDLYARSLIRFARENTDARILLVVDDGWLGSAGHQAERRRFYDMAYALTMPGVSIGWHSCAPLHPDIFRDGPLPVVLSYDASLTDHTSASGRSMLAAVQGNRAGYIAGIIRTDIDQVMPPDPGLLAAHFPAAVLKDPPSWLGISGACGTGLRTEEFSIKLAETLESVVV